MFALRAQCGRGRPRSQYLVSHFFNDFLGKASTIHRNCQFSNYLQPELFLAKLYLSHCRSTMVKLECSR
jgi:hypothetical protein